MKRVAIILCIVLLCGVAAPGWAESDAEMQVTIDYEGAWVPFAQENFRLFLPSTWMIVKAQTPEEGFVVVSADGKQTMWIDVFEVSGLTIDGLLESFQAVKGFENVRAVYFNGVAFVCYASPESGVFGAVTFSADSTKAYFFKFMPYGDEALDRLAAQIMSTLSPIGD